MLIPIPDLLRAKTVLCVQPHYDDNDIGAGGTIARLAQGGAEVHYLTVTDDVVGVLDRALSDADARTRLAAEQLRAGAELGVRAQHRLDFPDAGEWSPFAEWDRWREVSAGTVFDARGSPPGRHPPRSTRRLRSPRAGRQRTPRGLSCS